MAILMSIINTILVIVVILIMALGLKVLFKVDKLLTIKLKDKESNKN